MQVKAEEWLSPGKIAIILEFSFLNETCCAEEITHCIYIFNVHPSCAVSHWLNPAMCGSDNREEGKEGEKSGGGEGKWCEEEEV